MNLHLGAIAAPDWNLQYKDKRLNNALLEAFCTIPEIDAFGEGEFFIQTTSRKQREQGYLSRKGDIFIYSPFKKTVAGPDVIRYKNASELDVLRHLILARIYHQYSNEVGGTYHLGLIPKGELKETDANFPLIAEFLQQEEKYIVLDKKCEFDIQPLQGRYVETDIDINDANFQRFMEEHALGTKIQSPPVPKKEKATENVVLFAPPVPPVSLEEMNSEALFEELKKRDIRLIDVGERIGVAKGTVSSVKNEGKPNAKRASEEMRQKVRESAIFLIRKWDEEARKREKGVGVSVQEEFPLKEVVGETEVSQQEMARQVTTPSEGCKETCYIEIKPLELGRYIDPGLYHGEVMLEKTVIDTEYPFLHDDLKVKEILRVRYGFTDAQLSRIVKIRQRNRKHFGIEFWSRIPRKMKYIGDAELLWDVLAGMMSGRHSVVCGPAGCGKSTLFETACCILNYVMFRGEAGNDHTGGDAPHVKAMKLGAFLYNDENVMGRKFVKKLGASVDGDYPFVNEGNGSVIRIHPYFRYGMSLRKNAFDELGEPFEDWLYRCEMTYGAPEEARDIVRQTEEDLFEKDGGMVMEPLTNETREVVAEIFQTIREAVKRGESSLQPKMGTARNVEQMLHQLMMGSEVREACRKLAGRYPENRTELLCLLKEIEGSGIMEVDVS